jgi:hypothetical protein
MEVSRTDRRVLVAASGNASFEQNDSPIGAKEVYSDQAPERTNQNLPPPNTEYVLLQNVMAGTGRLAFFGCDGERSIGRGPQFVRFRRFLLDKLFGSRESCEIAEKGPIGYITFPFRRIEADANHLSHFFTTVKETSRPTEYVTKRLFVSYCQGDKPTNRFLLFREGY